MITERSEDLARKKYTQRILLQYLLLPRLHSYVLTYVLRTTYDTDTRLRTVQYVCKPAGAALRATLDLASLVVVHTPEVTPAACRNVKAQT